MIEHDVFGPQLIEQIKAGASCVDIRLHPPWHPEIPAEWWDVECDKSLLIGIYKHGVFKGIFV
jgi:hypothetical protein